MLLPVTMDFSIQPLAALNQLSAACRHQLLQYEFLLAETGSGILVVDGQRYSLEAGTVCCLQPGQVRSINAHSSMEGFYLSVPADYLFIPVIATGIPFLSSLYGITGKPLCIRLPADAGIDLMDILIKLQKECSSGNRDHMEMLKSLFRVFLLYVSRHFTPLQQPAANRRDKSLVNNFMQLLTRNFSTRRMVVDYAGELCVTPGYLNQVVKRVSGFTASHHIQQCVVREAKRQAIHYGRSMKEIAYGLGFDDVAHFSKFFKNSSGSNFSSFIKTIS